MKKTYFKLAFFLISISALVICLKKNTIEFNQSKNANDYYNKELIVKDTTFYFIGSSRVQRSVNPTIIGNHFKNAKVLNLGISGGTFLCNQIIANAAIKDTTGYKILFIELSPITSSLPSVSLSSVNLPPPFIDPLLNLKINILKTRFDATLDNFSPNKFLNLTNMVNDFSYSIISPSNDLKKILYNQTIQKTNPTIGFQESNENNYHFISSFLKFEEINKSVINSMELTEYTQVIEKLNITAKKNNARLVFFLPTTFKTQEERDIVCSMYNLLPKEMKLEYTNTFLQKIRNPKYLLNKNHLNSAGAKVYSKSIIPIIENNLRLYQ